MRANRSLSQSPHHDHTILSTPPISPDELQDLSNESGHPLTEEQAHKYRKRRIHEKCVESMLSETRGKS